MSGAAIINDNRFNMIVKSIKILVDEYSPIFIEISKFLFGIYITQSVRLVYWMILKSSTDMKLYCSFSNLDILRDENLEYLCDRMSFSV